MPEEFVEEQEIESIADNELDTEPVAEPEQIAAQDVQEQVTEPEPAAIPTLSPDQLNQLNQQIATLTSQLAVAQQLNLNKPVEPTPPAEPKLTREQIDDMREYQPVIYEQYLIEQGKKAALAEIGDIDSRIQRVQQSVTIEQKFQADYPRYASDPVFKADVDYVMQTMGGNTPVHKLAAAALVEKYKEAENKEKNLIAAAKIQGAKDEVRRAATAGQGVVPGTPKPAEQAVAIDPYYAKYASAFGVDPKKLQQREKTQTH